MLPKTFAKIPKEGFLFRREKREGILLRQGLGKKVPERDAEGIADQLEVSDGNVGFAEFDTAQVRLRNACPLSQFVLRISRYARAGRGSARQPT